MEVLGTIILLPQRQWSTHRLYAVSIVCWAERQDPGWRCGQGVSLESVVPSVGGKEPAMETAGGGQCKYPFRAADDLG